MKKLISLFCIVMTLFTSFVTPSLAEERTETVPYYDVSDVADDLRSVGIDPALYFGGSGDFSVLYVGEVGYESGVGDKELALYIYVYNPEAKAVNQSSVSNTVQIAASFDGNGDAETYTKFRLQLVDSNDNILLKFKVTASDLSSFAERVGRRYRISGLTLAMYGKGAKEVPVGKTWAYTGSAMSEDLACRVTEEGVAEISLHSTTYRYNNGIDTDTVLYSVYFSMDPRYEKENVTLTGYKASAYRATLSPIVVIDPTLTTDDIEAPGNYYDNLKKYAGTRMPENDGTHFPFLTTVGTSVDGYGYYRAGWNVNEGTNSFPYWLWQSNSFHCREVFDLTWLFARPLGTEWTVESEEIEQYARTYKGSLTGKSFTAGDVSYSLDLFTAMPEYVEIVKDNGEDSFTLEGAGSNAFVKFFLDHFWHVKTEDIAGIQPILSVDIKDVQRGDYAEILLIGDGEAADFKDFVLTERGKGNKVYLLRFATEAYTGEELRYHSSAWYLGGVTAGTLVTNAVVYLDFDVLELHYKDEVGDVTVLPVVSDPVTVIPDISQPMDEGSIGNGIEDLFAFLGQGIKIIAGIAVIVILVSLVVYFVREYRKRKRERERDELMRRYLNNNAKGG